MNTFEIPLGALVMVTAQKNGSVKSSKLSDCDFQNLEQTLDIYGQKMGRSWEQPLSYQLN